MSKMLRVVALAGGVGGAKLVDGLAGCLPPEALTVVVNTGDDFEHLGLTICPDLDTVCYTLADLANTATGWGRVDETWHAIEASPRSGDQPGSGLATETWAPTWSEPAGCVRVRN